MKNFHIISTALVLGLLAPVALGYADDNNLVQLDLKKSSQDSVDVTLVTSQNYGDNVIVRKKSDNKYVILVPKVQSSGFNAANLNGVRDVISNIDVKTVDDTTGGYTKVTLITTKPLDIKTRTIKSKPVTTEQKEYNTLIAQANSIKNTVSEPPKLREQKTEITVNKTPKQETKQQENKIQQPAQSKKEPKVEPKKEEVKASETSSEKIEKQNRKSDLVGLINEVKAEKALEEIEQNVSDENIQNTQVSEENSTQESAKPKHSSKLPKALGLLILAIAGLTIIRRSNKKTKAAIQQINNKSEKINIDNKITQDSYDNIINDNNLSWKEKYQLYLDQSAQPVSRGENKGNYTFIKTPAQNNIDQKRKELEKMISPEKPSEEKIEIVEDKKVFSEDSAISKTIKFKAFENTNKSLNIAKRHKSKSRFVKYETENPIKPQRTVQLNNSPLNISSRNLNEANLQVSDVDKNKIKYEPTDYIMSSVDEYLNILDNEKRTTETKKQESYFTGTIVKSGHKIAPDKGFYIVNKDGKNALVGKINDKVIVLKKFENNITQPIQVRHDKDNIYMVKAGGFKSMVEVNDENMGVLIEL